MANISYPQLRQRLIVMVKADQEMRMEAIHHRSVWDETIDIRNTDELKQIIAKFGWPTIPKVGVEASGGAWLIAQHADHDRPFQRECLKLLKKLSKNEISLHNIAYLEDRLLIADSKPQLYGTQFEGSGPTLRPRPIEDPSRVDERRSHMGLGKLADYTQAMLDMYSEG